MTGDKVFPKGNEKTTGKKDTHVKGHAGNQSQKLLLKSIVCRQESLLQRINALITEAKKEVSNAFVDCVSLAIVVYSFKVVRHFDSYHSNHNNSVECKLLYKTYDLVQRKAAQSLPERNHA